MRKRERENTEEERLRNRVRRKKNKIIEKVHQFFMNFHLEWERPLTAIDRSSCCHTVSTWGPLEGPREGRAVDQKQRPTPSNPFPKDQKLTMNFTVITSEIQLQAEDVVPALFCLKI